MIKDKKTILLQLFAEESEPVVETVVEESEPTTEPTESTEGETPVEEPTEPVSYRDLEYKFKDEKGKLGDLSPEDVVKNFQLGRKYQEHESDITFTKKLKELYGAKDVDELNKIFDEAIEANIRASAPEGIPESELPDYVEFKKEQQRKAAEAPSKEREATMLKHIEALKKSGKIKTAADLPESVLDIYKARGYTDLEGAFDSYELQQVKTKLKESENANSSPGSLKSQPVIPAKKSVSQMSKAEYEAFKEERRAIAQANGG